MHSGDDYGAFDVTKNPALNDAQVATYCTAIRKNGEANGAILGALGIFFDWEPQAKGVTQGVRLLDAEKGKTRCLLLDSNYRIIAASDGVGILKDSFSLEKKGENVGHYRNAAGQMVGYALTPGYETYEGLGWYGVVVQDM